AVLRAYPAATVTTREVDDEDWARRSQENLQPVTVGRITVAPPWAAHASAATPTSDRITVVILPSMGFGTGHHATTRLCLEALQQIDLRGKTMLDVGTGSGVLAIAARFLGACDVVGVDYDEDAIQSAVDNRDLNPSASDVRFDTLDLRHAQLRASDVVTANLTGALLVHSAALLLGALSSGGTLIVSGLQQHERDEIVASMDDARLVWEGEEAGWVGLAFVR
ncbi:MAG: 50S ribosomal protein L11 methyltransferase, partial [Acidobacteriaceae bacterium]|nr:50S ribosomal protein L11 methyltransferase [Acidobacteriaceae bacterium]